MLGALRGAAHTGSEAASSDGAAAAGTAGELPAHLADWDGSYATAYVDGASSEEDDEGYWRGAWSEDVRSGGLDSPGPAEPSPEAQWPTPAHWPRPAAADGEPCAAEVRVLPGRGRAAIATRQLRPGDEVGLERPFAFVVRATHAGSSCAHCAASVAKGGHQKAAGCVFCSADCERAAAEGGGATYMAHVGALPAIAERCSVDLDLLRILLRLCCVDSLRAALEVQRSAAPDTRDFDPATDHAAAHAVLALCTHSDALHGSWVSAVSEASAELVRMLPEAYQLPVEELVALAARVNSNAYGISDPSGLRNLNVGFGLFPFAAMLNHSCEPNCAFGGVAGGCQTIRAIKPIAEGDELCFGYIDLYQDVARRRDELEETKHFLCECPRCVTCLRSPDSGCAILDRRISGILCPGCVDAGDEGVLRPPGLLHDTQHNNDLLANFVRGAEIKEEISHPRCDTCGATTPTAWVQQAEQKAAEAFGDVEKIFDKATTRAELEEARRGLEIFLEVYRGKLLHRHHALCFRAHCHLASCCGALEHAAPAASQLRSALRCALTVLNRNRSETAHLFLQLGEALERAGSSRVECERAFEQSRAIFAIVYGESHPATRQAAMRARPAGNHRAPKRAVTAQHRAEQLPPANEFVAWETQHKTI